MFNNDEKDIIDQQQRLQIQEDEYNLNVEEFVRARNKEICEMETTLGVKKKKSLAWQRIPFYKRRRSRNYDSRMSSKRKKNKQRKKDRHFLRTHTYFAKRFFMLNLSTREEGSTCKLSIPLTRKIKSSKFIYKSILSSAEFVFDETFQGVFRCSKKLDEDAISITTSNGEGQLAKDDVESTVLYKVGEDFCKTSLNRYKFKLDDEQLSCLSIINIKASLKNNSNTLMVDRHIYKRNQVMKELQTLIYTRKIIPICLDELFRICLETRLMCEYDYVDNIWFQRIHSARISEIISKYKKTPKGKCNFIEIEKIGFESYLTKNRKINYFIFQVVKKGMTDYYAYIENSESKVIGRVIRGGFCYSSGRVEGLGFIENQEVCVDDIYYMRNFDQSNYYEIKIIKVFDGKSNE